MEEVKITKIIFAVLAAFLVCWTPAYTFEILGTLLGDYKMQCQVYLIMFYTGAPNCAINPVIYGLMQHSSEMLTGTFLNAKPKRCEEVGRGVRIMRRDWMARHQIIELPTQLCHVPDE